MSEILITSLKRNSLDDGPGIRTVVFFKGCPLSCVWCQNPENMSTLQQIVYEASDCLGCNDCMKACDEDAITIQSSGAYPVNIGKCILCGKCTGICPSKALRFAGKVYSTDDLCKRLLRDQVFYNNTGGGVTFSGGEPTLHMDYVAEVARKLKEKDIHICLETCGYYDNEMFEEKLLPCLDLIYYDIKLFDKDLHREFCGVSNETILSNLESLINNKNVTVLPRIPLVPGITTEKNNLESIRDFFSKIGIREIGLLPYNPLWLSKLPTIGDEPEYERDKWMDDAEKDAVKSIFSEFRFKDF